MPSRLKGAARVRRILKRLPDEMRGEVLVDLNLTGRQLLAAMQADAPRRTGALAAGLSMKVYPKTLRLRVGYIGKPVNRKLFYGRILEFGRGLKKSTDRRGRKIGVIKPKRFVTGPRTDLRKATQGTLRDVWGKALARAAQGAGGDD